MQIFDRMEIFTFYIILPLIPPKQCTDGSYLVCKHNIDCFQKEPVKMHTASKVVSVFVCIICFGFKAISPTISQLIRKTAIFRINSNMSEVYIFFNSGSQNCNFFHALISGFSRQKLCSSIDKCYIVKACMC